MVSDFLTSSYLQYKADTNAVASWLATTARKCGYTLGTPTASPEPASTDNLHQPSKRLKGKARKQARAGKSSQGAPRELPQPPSCHLFVLYFYFLQQSVVSPGAQNALHNRASQLTKWSIQIPLQYQGDWLPGSLLTWARDLMAIGSKCLAALRTVSNHQAARIHDLEELLHSHNIAFPPSTPLYYDLAVDTHEIRPLQQGDVRYFRWEIEKDFAAFASALEENNDEVEGEMEGEMEDEEVDTDFCV
ncbi:conserved hypothetical protein [Coccidioides posadasii str. Silveira]|uniref:DUF6604 domain-containing protein n=1 Tax=Coccidioides posadasii (strain RMSCC 757 / Silveira) TaxID=443226 RepID=E9DH16_COCPS|nr:conserved hypothetical protein [Coccidioides posadasii str. Silveira]